MRALGNLAIGTERVILDTSVLFPAALRDVLLLSAERRLYEPRWTEEILDELRRNLVRDRHLIGKNVERMIAEMRRTFPGAIVRHHHSLLTTMRNHPSDRHVLAAAVAVEAPTIITFNLRHFPTSALEPYGVVATSPDEFLTAFAEDVPDIMLSVVEERARNLRNPPKSVAEVLTELRGHIPGFVAVLENLAG